MDNSQDTAATLNVTALLDVKIVFTQIADTTTVATP